MIVRISDDALARALGADELAAAFAQQGPRGPAHLELGHALARAAGRDRRAWASARPTLDDVDAILDGTERQGASARSPSTRSSPASSG